MLQCPSNLLTDLAYSMCCLRAEFKCQDIFSWTWLKWTVVIS